MTGTSLSNCTSLFEYLGMETKSLKNNSVRSCVKPNSKLFQNKIKANLSLFILSSMPEWTASPRQESLFLVSLLQSQLESSQHLMQCVLFSAACKSCMPYLLQKAGYGCIIHNTAVSL